MQVPCTLALAGACLLASGAALRAAEICHSQSAQYADTRTCVTSALPKQGGNTYGPEHLGGASEGAWCEGVAGPGIGQSITVHQNPAQVIGSMVVTNGYAKTPEAFRANARVKRARIETSGGVSKVVTLKDTREMEDIKLSPSKVSWVRLTILEIYPGEKHADTCISKFYFNHEEFGAPEDDTPADAGQRK
jgi:nucleoid-associated protein YgaU